MCTARITRHVVPARFLFQLFTGGPEYDPISFLPRFEVKLASAANTDYVFYSLTTKEMQYRVIHILHIFMMFHILYIEFQDYGIWFVFSFLSSSPVRDDNLLIFLLSSLPTADTSWISFWFQIVTTGYSERCALPVTHFRFFTAFSHGSFWIDWYQLHQ